MTASKGAAGYWPAELAADLLAGKMTGEVGRAVIALVAPYGVDGDEFLRWLAPLIGDYRGRLEFTESAPAFAQQRAQLERFEASLGVVTSNLFPGSLPDDMRVAIGVTFAQNGHHWHELRNRMLQDAQLLQEVLHHVLKEAAKRPAARGRRSTHPRDRLLDTVAERLRSDCGKAGVARRLAAEVLVCCGIPLSAGVDTKKAARRGKK